MSTEKNAMPDEPLDTSDESEKCQAASPVSYTEVGSAELVISGSGANIIVNKASSQDFKEIFEYAFQKGRSNTMNGETINNQEEAQGNAGATSKPARTKVFICYSRADKKYLTELQAHLAYYVRNEMISSWDDTQIKAGTVWYEEIQKGLQAAKVAVLLVSPEFFASDFIANDELSPLLKAAAEEGVLILSVILRPSAFKHSDLARIQAVNDPSQPLSAMARVKRDAVWAKVAEYIKDAL